MTDHLRMKGSAIPEGTCGDWTVERFTVSQKEAESFNLRESFQAMQGRGGREIDPGTYTRLMRNGTLVMSDTPAEISDHMPFVRHARGRVLITGLGLGVVTRMVLDKPEVEHVTVIEKSKDVCTLVAGAFQADVSLRRLEIIVMDALEWKPPKGARWDCIWHDIWDNICADNLPEMRRLKRKLARRTDWQACWCENECRRADCRAGW